jgi:hypothetical protein
MIIKYKVFKSSEEFEQFQETGKVRIHAISPVALDIGFNHSENKSDGGLNFGCFVTYIDKVGGE